MLVILDSEEGDIQHTIELGGQPDSVAVSPDGSFIVIAIENERDEDLGDGEIPQMPAGYVVVIDSKSDDPTEWTRSDVDVTGLDGVYEPSDPEPEYVSINSDNVAAVTLQENNAIVLIDLATLTVTNSFSCGTVDLTQIDIDEEDIIDQNSSLSAVPREPDGVVWIGTEYIVTADEGDMLGGSRGFTIFDTSGEIVYSSGSEMDHIAAMYGHYPENRSGNKGNEPENISYGEFGKEKLLFVNSERANLVFVYDVSKVKAPKFLQALPAGVGPEGLTVIEDRNLVIVASEVDNRDDKIRSVVNIYQKGDDKTPDYPTLISDDGEDGVPIPWAALSGLSHGEKKDILYSVEDSAYNSNRIFKISTKDHPAVIEEEIVIVDSLGVFAAVEPEGEFTADDLAAMINDDGTVNIDQEGIAYNDDDDTFWVASEGRGTIGDESRPIEKLNFLFKIDMDGVIHKVVKLPEEVNNIQLRFGFEGVTIDGDYVVVAFQRVWNDEEGVRIGLYNTVSDEWKFGFYTLDEPESQNGGWVGLSDISSEGDGTFLVLERDNQGGPDAAIKRIYRVELGDLDDFADGTSIEKTLAMDLYNVLSESNGLMYEKLEGMAITDKGVWVCNDNDGVDDNSGETYLVNVGKIE